MLTLAAAAPSAADQPYSEVGSPAGRFAGGEPKGWVMLLHGGGWRGVGKDTVTVMRPEARRFRRAGWATLSTDYRAGSASLTDATAAYDAMRARLGAATRICLYGQSAGGHLAMLLASMRPTVSCVVAEGAPMDLAALARQKAYDSATRGQQSTLPRQVAQLAIDAWGAANLGYFSPLRWVGSAPPTLLGTAVNDPMMPLAQMRAMRAANPRRITTMTLAAGTPATGSSFAHAYVSRRARARWNRAWSRLLAASLRAPGPRTAGTGGRRGAAVS